MLIIHSLKVVNYPLFNYGEDGYWSFDIQDGINIILGANSIGKTTTVNMIKFAFVGNYKEINTNYFSERLKPFQRKNKQYIILQFSLNGHLVEIHRNIISGNLEKFIVSHSEISTSEYESFINKNSHIDLEKLCKLLELMLIRVEEGNYILWNKSDQIEIMSILLNDVDFQEQFFKDESEYQNIKNELKNITNLIGRKKEQKQVLRKEIQNKQNKKNEKNNILDLQEQLTTSKSQQIQITQKIKNAQNKLNAENLDLKPIYQNFEKIRLSLRLTQSQIRSINLEIKIIKEKLNDVNIADNCILCSTKLPTHKAQRIHKKYFFDKMCPVCDSSLGEKIEEEDRNVLMLRLVTKENDLNSLDSKLNDIKNKYNELEQKKNTNEQIILNLREYLENKEKELYELKISILDLQKTIDLLKQRNPNEPSNDDISLNQVSEEIKRLIQERIAKEQDKQKLESKILEQRDQRNKVLTSFYERLNTIFKNYSKEYFVEDCELVFCSAKSDLITIKNFVPMLDGVNRPTKSSVSHSQLVFLEYLFRVSLLELYFEETKTKPFLILETSEGVFDTANTEAAAQLFSKFALDKFPVVLVCNLSKMEFIKKLFKSENEKNNRLFNLIQYGKLTLRQQQNQQLKLYLDITH